MNYRTKNIIDPPIAVLKKHLADIANPALPVIDLTQAVPAYPMPSRMRDVLVSEVDDSFSYYTSDPGLDDLRSKISLLYNKNHRLQLSADNIIITAGANQASFNVFNTLFNPGDICALPVPYYFNYDMALKMLNVEPCYYRLKEENNFKLISSDISDQFLSNCKAVVVINPNNPTGAEYSIDELLDLYRRCKERGVYLIVDETYGFFAEKGYPGSSLFNYIDDLSGVIILNTFSKTFSLTGFRVGFIVADKKDLKEIIKVQDTIIICAPRVSQRAALIGMDCCMDWVYEKTSQVHKNNETFKNVFNSNLNRFKLASIGSFFAYIKHPYASMNSHQACEFIARKASIMVLPGEVFGPDQQSYVRLSSGNISSREKLDEIISRLQKIENL